MKVYLFLIFVLLTTFAVAEETKLNAESEQRLKALALELRCLVCQNQTIADSNADLAIDLRTQIREQIQAGKSDAQIKEYMVARYGDFVLYRPPVQSNTLLLWVAPFLLLAGGITFLIRQLAQRRRLATVQSFSADELRRADELLSDGTANESNNIKS